LASQKPSLTVPSHAKLEPRVARNLPLVLLQEEEYVPCRSYRGAKCRTLE